MTLWSFCLFCQEFSLISNGESLGTLENIQKEINKYKVCEGLRDGHLSTWKQAIIYYVLCPQNQYDALVKDQNIFKDAIDSNKNYAKQFQERREEKKMSLDTDKKKQVEKIQKEVVNAHRYKHLLLFIKTNSRVLFLFDGLDSLQEQQRSLQKEHERLRAEIIRIKEELDYLEKKNDHLKQQTEVSRAF